MGELLDACIETVGASAELVWTSPDVIDKAGIEPWTELPIWVPPTGEMVGLHAGDVSAAFAHGLACRPMKETVRDTWRWLLDEGDPKVPGVRAAPGLDAAREDQVLKSMAGESGSTQAPT